MAEQVTCPRCGGSGTVRNGREVGCARCLATLRVDPYDLSARPVRHVKFDQTPRPYVHAEAECALGKFTALFPKDGAQ